MQNVNGNPADLLHFLIDRKLTHLAKNSLEIVEDLIASGYVIPQWQFDRIRKKTLDSLSEAKKEIAESLSKFNINI